MVASHLKRKKRKLGLRSVKFSLASGNPLLPIVVLSPEGTQVGLLSLALRFVGRWLLKLVLGLLPFKLSMQGMLGAGGGGGGGGGGGDTQLCVLEKLSFKG